ncbi:MAG: hypothetical protein LBJ59_12060 [Zoogloeaceae bacterium]|jgi:glycerophosphoryl diester phosphodiesterase|nr:hypothetical protein [Zoogloeaceae bacterium]
MSGFWPWWLEKKVENGGSGMSSPRVDPRICAHRLGGALVEVENTLSGFRAALVAGVQQFETDIQLTSDGCMVIMHDDTVDRMCVNADGSPATGAVNSMTAAQVRDLLVAPPVWFGSQVAYPPEPVPFVEDVLDVAAGHDIVIHFEIKNTAAALPLVAELNRRNWPRDKIVITSFSAIALQAAIAAGYQAGLIGDVVNYTDFVDLKAQGIDYFDASMGSITPECVAAAHAAGVKITAWTLIRQVEADRMFAMGVDFVTTDDPLWVARATTPATRDPYALARRWQGYLESFSSGVRNRGFENNGEFWESGPEYSGILQSWGCPILDPENWSLNFDVQIDEWMNNTRHADVTVLQSDAWWTDGPAENYTQLGFNVFERASGEICIYRLGVGAVNLVATHQGAGFGRGEWQNYTLTVVRVNDDAIRVTYRNNSTGNSVNTTLPRAHAGRFFYLAAGAGDSTVRFRNVRIFHGAFPFRKNVVLAIEGSATDISPNDLQLIPHGGAEFVDGVATLGNGTVYFETAPTPSGMLYNDFTIEFTARNTDAGTKFWGVVFANKTASAVSHVAFCNRNPGARQMQMRSNGGVRVDSGVFANNTDWHEWCITRNGTVQTIYMDGKKLGVGAFDSVWQYSPAMLIGAAPEVEPNEQYAIDLSRLRVTRACRYFGDNYDVPATYRETAS